MAFVLQEGFQNGSYGWAFGMGAGIITNNGRYDGALGSLTINGSNSNFYGFAEYYSYRSFAATKTMTVGFDMNLIRHSIYNIDGTNNNPNTVPILTLTSGGRPAPQGPGVINICVFIRWNNSIKKAYPMFAKDNVGSSIIASGLPIENFSYYGYNHYELEFDAGTTGFARLYVNGKMVLNVPSANFAAGSTQSVDTVTFYAPQYISTTSADQPVYYDNLYITDTASRLGEINIISLRPTADTVQKQWTPSTGTTNYNMVNAVGYSNSQTNNISASTTARDLYDIADLSSVTTMDGKIHGITVNSYGYKTAPGTVTVSNALRTNNATFFGAQTTLNEAQSNSKLLGQLSFTTNPATGQPWTLSDINALQTGIDLTLLSDFVFSVGQTGAITNNTTSTLVAGDVAPTVNSDGSLVFTGTQRIRYTDSPQFRVTYPYSVEFEFQTVTPNVNQQIFNIGGDLVSIYPELEFRILGGQLVVRTSSANDAGSTVQSVIIASVVQSAWYKIGCMIYMKNSQLMMRIYVNDIIVNDGLFVQPYDSTGGTGIGGSINFPEYFNGTLRNLRVGQRLFWPVVDPNNLLTLNVLGTIDATTTAVKDTSLGTDPAWDNTNKYLTFNGSSQLYRYTDTVGSYNQIVDPLSMEIDVSFNSLGAQVIATLGQNAAGYPGIDIRIDPTPGGSGLMSSLFSSNNTSTGQYLTYVPLPNLAINTWYKIGCMIYTLSGNKRCRGYVNGVQVFDSTVTSNSSLLDRIAIGSDYGTTISRPLDGKIRSMKIAKSRFWSI